MSGSSNATKCLPESHSREAWNAGAFAVCPGPEAGVAGEHSIVRRGLAAVILVWSLGSAVLVVRLVSSCVRVWRIRQSGRTFSRALSQTAIDEVGRRLRTGWLPAILISQRVASPVAVGLFRGAVILPVNLAKRITTRQLCDVLIHECAHVVRRDPLIVFLQAVAGSLFWPIPFVHRLNRQLSRVREDLCDNHVLADQSPLDYARTLLRVAELGEHARRPLVLVGMFHGCGELESRIASMIDERRNKATHAGRLKVAVCLVAFLLAGAVASGVTIDAVADDAGLAGARTAQTQPPAQQSGSTRSFPLSPRGSFPFAGSGQFPISPRPQESLVLDTKTKASADATEPRRIQIWWGIQGPLGDALSKQLDSFNESQTRIRATMRMLAGYEGVRRELQKAFQTGDLPDVAIVEVHQIASLAAQHKIEPLDRFVKNDPKFQPGDLLPGLLTNIHYRHELYALPINRSTPVLYYNKDRFAAAGLDPDKPPQTWEEVRDMSETLTSKDGRQYGLLTSASPWIFESMVWSDGGELIAGGKANFATAGAKPLQLWADMVHRDKTARFGVQRDIADFYRGQAAMFLESTAVLQMLTSNCAFKLGTAPLPRSEGFKNAVSTGGGAAVIPTANSAEQKQAAWAFLTWLIATKQAAAWSRGTGYIPVRESARALLEKEGFYREHPSFEIAIKELSFARESPQVPEWGTAWEIIRNAMSAVVRFEAPALETLKVAEGDVDQLLKSPAAPKP